ncbi:MAG: hypothetical protein MSA90_11665 [Faecalicatena sp.]|uniref:hypothetical protein n=1 Tax=Faecalicatena sp. TaxID=2005360 RepID=UPI00258CC169|nr:hypothetical protein [Faecalicatena sp.]MCI6466109.1 hypothetical protein [Faecalicatena sp.]MDY5619272.1 hypothetical protein [Lachnospiraceae bacterium]
MKTIGFILSGIIISTILFILGDMDDAPGLSFIGLAAAFLLVMRGIYHAGAVRSGYYLPIILLVFGAVGIIFPIVLLLDGEIKGVSPIVFVGNITGIVMITIAVLRIKQLKKKN